MDRRLRFEEVYVEQGPALRTFVHRRVDPAVADDVVAEVFLAAWRRYDEMPSDPLPWLLGIARGILANQRRGHTRRSALYERLASSTPPDYREPRHEARGDLSPVLQACASLGSRDQEILLLVAWDGLDRAQAARVLGISTAKFAVRLHRARRRLQRALDAGPLRLTPTDSPSASEVS
jgi:RNA polymerase sigma-70 factor (ECF subfamily)